MLGSIMTKVSVVTQRSAGRPRRGSPLDLSQLALPLVLSDKPYGRPGTVRSSVGASDSTVRRSEAKQEAGELRRMKDPDSLAASLERLTKLAETADATGEDSQEFIDARNILVVAAAKAGASRGQIARLTGVSDGTVIDILERAKNNGRPRRG